MPLSGQTAFVTGAGRGIGRAVAVALAEAGAAVAVNDLVHGPELEQTAAAVRAAGRRALPLAGDVSDQARVEAMFDEAAQALGRLDIAVANAYYSAREPFHEADMARFRRTVDVTLWGAFYTLRAAARVMIPRRSGSVVFIGSPHAIHAIPRAMAYNLSKAAVDQMARTAAIELAEHKVRVNIVHPGWIDTPGERDHASDEQIARAAAKLPWGRLGRPEEVARGVVWLCDPRSDYITGTTLGIDGGITLPWWASRGSAVPE